MSNRRLTVGLLHRTNSHKAYCARFTPYFGALLPAKVTIPTQCQYQYPTLRLTELAYHSKGRDGVSLVSLWKRRQRVALVANERNLLENGRM
jgi:hypothetical protein